MDNFFILEKKCKKLQQKKFLKIIGVSGVIIGVLVSGYYFFIPKNTTKPHKIVKNTQKHSKPTPQKAKQPIPKSHKPTNLTTSQVKPQKIEKKIEKPKENISKTKKTPKIQKPQKIEKPKVKKDIPILDIDVDLDSIPSSTNTTKKPIIKQTIKKPILKTENITFTKAIKLAKLYYNNGDYQNSIKWAKIASSIDNDDERVWKYYALSLEKLGKKAKAIYILKTYLKYKNSIELKYILQRLEK